MWSKGECHLNNLEFLLAHLSDDKSELSNVTDGPNCIDFIDLVMANFDHIMQNWRPNLSSTKGRFSRFYPVSQPLRHCQNVSC